MPPTKKQTRVAQKGKKEPMRYMAVSSAVYKASAKEQRAFHEMFKQGISKKKHVVVDGNMVITTVLS